MYKVVRRLGKEELHSLIVYDPGFEPFARTYKIGTKTLPPSKYPQAWLYAFKYKRHAIASAEKMSNLNPEVQIEVYKVEATQVKECSIVSSHLAGASSLRYFWAVRKGFKSFTMSPPKGTYLCSDITLLELIWSTANDAGRTVWAHQ